MSRITGGIASSLVNFTDMGAALSHFAGTPGICNRFTLFDKFSDKENIVLLIYQH